MAFNVSYLLQVIDKSSGPLAKIASFHKRMAEAARRAGRATVKAFGRAKKAALNALEAFKKANGSLKSFGDVAGRVAGILAGAFALALPIKQAIDFEAAMSDVAKVVDFKEPGGLKKMGKSIQEMSKTLPIAQTGLAAIVAAGGQLGVPAKELEKFTILTAKMSIAFDIGAEQAGESMAKLSNILKVPISEMESVGDAINFVSNAAAASAAEIVTALRSGAGSGAQALGLTKEQAIALSTAFIAQGLSASEAGTRVNTLARNLTNTTKTTKALGAGFTRLVKENPQKAIDKLLESMKSGKVPSEVFIKLLGETVNDFKLLASNGKEYTRILGLVADKTKFAGSMTKEFEARTKTTDAQLQLLGNSVRNVGINFGTVLLPVIVSIAQALASVSNGVADLIEEFPIIAKFASVLAVTFIAAKIATLGFALVSVRFGKIMKIMRVATLSWAAAMKVLNIVMRANPLGLVITVISLLITAFIIFQEEIEGLIDSFLKFTGLSGVISKLFSFGEDEKEPGKTPTPKGVDSPPPPPTQDIKGQMEIGIKLSGNTEAVESATARPLGGGKLGMNMAFAL